MSRSKEDTKFCETWEYCIPFWGAISRFPNCITVLFSEYCRIGACVKVVVFINFLLGLLERSATLEKFEGLEKSTNRFSVLAGNGEAG